MKMGGQKLTGTKNFGNFRALIADLKVQLKL
jgi:hypothetical protein